MARDGEIEQCDDDADVTPPRASTPIEGELAGGDAAGILPRTLDARALLGDGRVLHIEHAGEIYTLRLTRNDRLILTK